MPLITHPAVADALVVGHDGPAGPGLVAYFVAAPDAATPTAADLRAHLGRRLPDYMVPGCVPRGPGVPADPERQARQACAAGP